MPLPARSLLNDGFWLHRFDDLYAKASPKVRSYLLATGFGMGGESIRAGPAPWLARVNELPPALRKAGIRGVAYGMASNDPQAAVEWALTLADPAERARDSILEQWLSVRPDEASAYARAMPAGAGHDHAIQSISEKVLLGSSEEIARWWSDLAAGDRKIARGVFDKTKLSDERRQKLDAALKGR